MLSTIVIGFAYNLLQMGFSIFTVVSGKRVLSSNGGYLFDFFGDKVHHFITNLQSFYNNVVLHHIKKIMLFCKRNNNFFGLILVLSF